MQTEMIKALMGAAGAGADYTYVESLYSIDPYIGTGSTITLNNGIDLSGEGGVVFIKRRDSSGAPYVFDTVRGANKAMMTNDQQSDFTLSNSLTAFNNNGFTIGTASQINTSGDEYVTWSIRKAKKFFTMGTYTGNGSSSQTINHDLGVKPGMMWVKKTDTNHSWVVYHKGMGLGSTTGDPSEFFMILESYAPKTQNSQRWNDTEPTSTQFTVGNHNSVNSNNATYQYYLFADDQQEFGLDDNHSIFKFGHYQGNGSSGQNITLGWEPQWLMVKCSEGWGNKNWQIIDSIRGVASDGNDQLLQYDTGDAETSASRVNFTSTGFRLVTSDAHFNDTGSQYLYWAIRRPDGYVGKPPELGSDCFAMDTGNSSSTIPTFDSGFPVDFLFQREPASGNHWRTSARLIGTNYLNADNTDAQASQSNYVWDSNVGALANSSWGSSKQAWMWKRHAGFDVVAFTGSTSDPGPSYAHGLGKIPELKIIKRRNASSTGWITTGTVVSQALAGNNNSKDYYLYLNTNAAATNFSNYWTGGNDSATHFTVRHGNGEAGGSADPYLCLLFASVEGISKVGYYTGNGQARTITVGFQPRFLLFKNIDQDQNWHILDTTRGWGSGNDPYLNLNSSAAQNSGDDLGAPTSTGFTWSGGGGMNNNSGDDYIYYAHS